MAVFSHILCLSAAIVVAFEGKLLFKNIFVTGSSDCSSYDFPCENGQCIDADLWCDSQEDCSDGSDERYCKKTFLFNNNPNKCPSNYFKCSDGPCIPKVGKCDGFKNCQDSSDEKGCQEPDEVSDGDEATSPSKPVTRPSETRTTSSTTSKPTIRTTTYQPRVNVESHSTHFSDSRAVQHSVDIVYSNPQPFDYSLQREKARNWLVSQRRSDFGWGDETPRALTALCLSDLQRSAKRNESDMLIEKQLEVQLSLDMSRNGTKAMKLTDLALYINALVACCKDPKNFYGENLVRTLRYGVNAAHRENIFVNPSVYLTLCLNNDTTYDDTGKLHDAFLTSNSGIGRIDIQSLAFLTATCIHKNTNLLTAAMYEGLKRQFLQRMNAGIPGNVYEASLLAQALQELKVTMPGLLEFTLRQQQEDGSFGGILATYLALPVLAGRSFLQIKEHCGQKYSTDLAPIAVLKNAKRKKMFVQYSLNYGYPPEVTETIQMLVSEGISFLDVMRLAEEINPKFRFMLDGNRDVPVVYSIGGIPNDAEKGMFWTLYLASAGRVEGDAMRLAPYSGNIKQLIPHAGDEFVFWMRSL